MTGPDPTAGGLTPEQLEAIRDDLEGIRRRLERSLKQSAAASRPVELDQTSVGGHERLLMFPETMRCGICASPP